MGLYTDHSDDIKQIRATAEAADSPEERVNRELAADLLELHDYTGISLDTWVAAREFVERYVGREIEENGV